MAVTKSDLTQQIAERAGLSQADAGTSLDAVLDAIQANLVSGQEVNITGFGKFSVAHRSAREGVNPSSGEKIQIAASKGPKFTPGTKLKAAVKGS